MLFTEPIQIAGQRWDGIRSLVLRAKPPPVATRQIARQLCNYKIVHCHLRSEPGSCPSGQGAAGPGAPSPQSVAPPMPRQIVATVWCTQSGVTGGPVM